MKTSSNEPANPSTVTAEKPATVLITRPSPGLEETRTVFEAAGFRAVPCPLLTIEKTSQPEAARRQLQQVSDWDTLIFPSQHAVEQAFALLPDWSPSPHTQLIAVGPRTAHRLMDCLPDSAPNPVLVPDKSNSEGVIELMQGLRKNNSVALITAPDGRQHLQNWLRQADGIHCWQEIFVYQRQHGAVCPECLHATWPFLQAANPEKSSENGRLFVLSTSVSVVTGLLENWPGDSLAALQQHPLVCASERIATAATDAGFSHCLIAEGAAPQHLLAAVRKACQY